MLRLDDMRPGAAWLILRPVRNDGSSWGGKYFAAQSVKSSQVLNRRGCSVLGLADGLARREDER